MRENAKKRLAKKTASSARAAWRRLEALLAAALRDLDEGDTMILVRASTRAFIQLDAGARGGATPDPPPPERPARPRTQAGRGRPRRGRPSGRPGALDSCTFDVEAPPDCRALAASALRTMRRVHGARRPGELTYSAFTEEGGDIRFPALGLEREPTEAPDGDPPAPWDPGGGGDGWKVVFPPDGPDLFVGRADDDLVAKVIGSTEDETYSLAGLIAQAPALRDAAAAAVELLREIAAEQECCAARAAGQVLPLLERALEGTWGVHPAPDRVN